MEKDPFWHIKFTGITFLLLGSGAIIGCIIKNWTFWIYLIPVGIIMLGVGIEELNSWQKSKKKTGASNAKRQREFP